MFDLVGSKFGRLSVESRAEPKPTHHGQIAWVCLCECGKRHESVSRDLRSGRVKSCGCWKADLCRAANTTHGCAGRTKKLKEYRIWSEMIQRCTNKKSARWYTHGGRGIKVCDRWRESFEAFLEDMKVRTSPGLSLERRDNNGDYTPENCYWATKEQQGRNRRTNHVITAGGRTQNVSAWSEETGVKSGTIIWRIKAGWKPERAVGLE